MIAIGATDVAGARFMITETRALTDRPFNVNLFVHAEPKADEARAENWLNALRPLFQIHGAESAATLRQLGMLFRPITVLKSLGRYFRRTPSYWGCGI